MLPLILFMFVSGKVYYATPKDENLTYAELARKVYEQCDQTKAVREEFQRKYEERETAIKRARAEEWEWTHKHCKDEGIPIYEKRLCGEDVVHWCKVRVGFSGVKRTCDKAKKPDFYASVPPVVERPDGGTAHVDGKDYECFDVDFHKGVEVH